MAVSIDATVGGANANSYCTLAEANTYHDSRPNVATWSAATDDSKNRALVEATRLLDLLVEWDGWVVNSTQRLLWPRTGMYGLNGYAIDITVIPQTLKDAVAEYARQLLDADRTADSDVETQKITHLKAGSVELSFGSGVAAKAVPDAVFYKVQHWGSLRSRSNPVVPLMRG